MTPKSYSRARTRRSRRRKNPNNGAGRRGRGCGKQSVAPSAAKWQYVQMWRCSNWSAGRLFRAWCETSIAEMARPGEKRGVSMRRQDTARQIAPHRIKKAARQSWVVEKMRVTNWANIRTWRGTPLWDSWAPKGFHFRVAARAPCRVGSGRREAKRFQAAISGNQRGVVGVDLPRGRDPVKRPELQKEEEDESSDMAGLRDSPARPKETSKMSRDEVRRRRQELGPAEKRPGKFLRGN